MSNQLNVSSKTLKTELSSEAISSSIPQAIKPELLKSQVSEILRKAIFTGKLRPGETLAEIRLARMLNVSQATVREALGQLEQMGIVVRVPNRSTSVIRLSGKEIQDRLRIRVVLEEMAALSAAPLLNQEDFLQLDSMALELHTAVSRNSYVEVSDADLRFHRYIWMKCDSPILLKTLEQLTTPLFAFLGLLHRLTARDQRTTKPHEAIVAALRGGNPTSVQAAIRDHIEGAYSHIFRSSSEDLQEQLDQLEG